MGVCASSTRRATSRCPGGRRREKQVTRPATSEPTLTPTPEALAASSGSAPSQSAPLAAEETLAAVVAEAAMPEVHPGTAMDFPRRTAELVARTNLKGLLHNAFLALDEDVAAEEDDNEDDAATGDSQGAPANLSVVPPR